jgi:hypothetical protein
MDENRFAAAVPMVSTAAARSIGGRLRGAHAGDTLHAPSHLPEPGGSPTMIVHPTISAGLALR